MKRSVIAIAALSLLGACALGRPPGFSAGQTWTFPLLGAAEGGAPVTPVYIDGKGPYLFYVDPDLASMVDLALARELGLWEQTSNRLKVVDSNDRISREQMVQVLVSRIRVGDLEISSRRMYAGPVPGVFRDQAVRGVIGGDIVAKSSLVWQLDRDREVLRVGVQGELPAPADAHRVPLRIRYGRSYAPVRVNDAVELELEVRLHGPSALWPELAEKAGAQVLAEGQWLAQKIAAGRAEVTGLVMLSFSDKRVDKTDHDGMLGQGFLSRFNITTNAHENAMWLQPRRYDQAMAADRLQRWGETFAACAEPACVSIRVVGDAAEPSGVSGVTTLVVDQLSGLSLDAYDVSLEPVDANGAALPLPRLRLAMPPGFRGARVPLDDTYADAAAFRVVDATPFPPPCQQDTGCVWRELGGA